MRVTMALMVAWNPYLTRSSRPRQTSKRAPAALENAPFPTGRPSSDGNDRATEGSKGWPRTNEELVAWPSPVPECMVTGLHKTLYRGVAQLALRRARAPQN
jgi:hypothetical protein